MLADDLRDRYSHLNAAELAALTLHDCRGAIIDQQRHQQSLGLASDGKPFINANTGEPTYSPGYAKKKGKASPIDLEDTGAFKRDIFVDVRTDTFVIDSADAKTDKLLKQFGGDIFGLNTDSVAEVAPVITKQLKENILQDVKG